MGTGDLHRVLDCFGAAVHKQSFLGKFSGRKFIHPLGKANIALVRRDLHASVKKAIQLFADSRQNRRPSMPYIVATDAASKIYVAVPVHILQDRIFGLRHIHRRGMSQPTWHRSQAAIRQCCRLGAWNTST